MPLDLATLDRHLGLLTGQLTVQFAWNGTPYSGIKTTPTISETLMIGGQDYEVAFEIFVRLAVVPSAPDIGNVFVVEGKHYKVLRVRPSPDNSQLLGISLGWARID